MTTVEISVRTNQKEIEKQLDYLQQKQLPYATALAINSMAAKVVEMEKQNIKGTFDRPTPFTMNALGFKPANKNKLQALVFVKDIQAGYLEPYEFGGKSVPHKVAMLNPKGIALNQYGNIPQNKIRSLLGLDLADPKKMKMLSQKKKATLLKNQKRYFIGKVKRGGKDIGGLWERLPNHKGLRLLVRFTDPVLVKEHLDYHKKAESLIIKHFDRILLLSIQHAIDTSTH